jgi:type II secretory pathway component PulF
MRLDIERAWARAHLSSRARLRLYRKIATLLSNGLPLLKALEELQRRESADGRSAGNPLAIVLADWRRTVQNGRMLSESMQGWVPHAERMIIMAGEQAGRIEDALLSVVGVVESASRIRNAIFGGLVYPCVILSLVLVYLYLFGTKVIPEFARISDPERWHGVARSLYLMSNFVQAWMPALVLAFVLAGIALFVSMPRWRGGARAVADRLPPYSVYRLMVGSSFLMAFSALQRAGMTVEKCLSRLREGASPWLRERLDGALLGVKSGLNCGESLRNAGYGFPSHEIVDDLCIYAEFRGFSEALQTLADEWMAEGVATITAQMKLLNGVAIVVLALSIAWLVSGFFGIQQEIATMTRAVR